jgi:SmpA / OmlA family
MGVLAILLAGGILWLLYQPKMETLAENVQVGMTQAQVKAIMGQPQVVENSGRRMAWWNGMAGVGVDFDAEGRVFYKTPVQRVSVFRYLIYTLGWR